MNEQKTELKKQLIFVTETSVESGLSAGSQSTESNLSSVIDKTKKAKQKRHYGSASMSEPKEIVRKMKSKTKRSEGNLLKRLIFWGSSILLVFAILLVSVFFLINRYIAKQHFTTNLPSINSLTEYNPSLISTVYSSDNKVVAEFFTERRIVIPFEKIPKLLVNAFIATEDERFWEHKGYDLFSMFRAFIKNSIAGKIVQGGSTITQQVAKTFVLSSERSYTRKLKEVMLAYQIEQKLTKQDILHLYLNQVYLGHGAYGVAAASENYFGKKVEHLSLAECAVLAGMVQSPGKYSPFKHLDRIQERQRHVLKRMYEEDYITKEQARYAIDEPLHFIEKRNLFLEVAPYYTEYIRSYIVEKYGKDLLYTGGLQIYSPIDTNMQKAASIAVQNGVNEVAKRHRYSEQLQGTLFCMDVKTGDVKAMVGGLDFKQSQFNRAVQARRQPGSALKPLIYCAGLDKGFTGASIFIDAPVVVPDKDNQMWKPENYEEKFFGPTRLRKALAYSRNLVTIKLLQEIGTSYAVSYAKRLGITSPLEPNLSLALGTSEVTLMELVSAYDVFANYGKKVNPIFITKIVDKNGKILEETKPVETQVIEESTAYLMTNLLEGVVNEGTGKRVKELKRPVAGKTGSTNDLRDAWFIGYTPDLIAGVWVGFDKPQKMGDDETGAKAASPIFVSFMKRVLSNYPVATFRVPEGVVFKEVDEQTGLLASGNSRKVVLECFKENNVPNQYTQQQDTNESAVFFKKN